MYNFHIITQSAEELKCEDGEDKGQYEEEDLEYD